MSLNLKILSFLLLVVGCREAQQGPKEIPRPIEVELSHTSNVPIYVHGIGYVYPPQEVGIRPEVTGILIKAHISEGEYVEEGTLLFSIDDSSYQAAYQNAQAILTKDEASLVQAENTLKRYTPLVEREFLSKLDYEQYESEVKILKAQVEADRAALNLAAINLERTQLYSPMNGTLGQSFIDVGNLVSPTDTTPIISILTSDKLEVSFALSQADFMALQRRSDLNPHKITYKAAHSTKEYLGSILFYDNRFEANTGTVSLRGHIKAPEGELIPGEFGTVSVLIEVLEQAVVVPESALLRGSEGYFLFVLSSEDRVKLRSVIPGPRSHGFVIIEKGLEVNEKVVINGQLNLRDGSLVYVVPAKKGQGS